LHLEDVAILQGLDAATPAHKLSQGLFTVEECCTGQDSAFSVAFEEGAAPSVLVRKRQNDFVSITAHRRIIGETGVDYEQEKAASEETAKLCFGASFYGEPTKPRTPVPREH
jgi:hypothetical protein